MNAHKITAEFEKALCEYCGSPYAVALDNCSSALFLALYYEIKINGRFSERNGYKKPVITIPKHTYMSVPCEIIHAGGAVEFKDNSEFGLFCKDGHINGKYRLGNTGVWDSALSFTHDMYIPEQHMCLSFTGPYKHLKLGKGGAILTDNEHAYKWFKKARFSGRSECSYHVDNFDDNPVVGWNMYMPIETSARGLHMMTQFYEKDGTPKHNEDLELPYPDLSKYQLWK